jgi:hypothetical protein
MKTDPLAALRPLRLPEAVGWWPPAPGWWLAAALALLAVWLAAGALLRYLRRNRYRRAARRELAQALREALAQGDTGAFLAHAATILRRAALCRYPSAEVASLHGHDWLLFLDRSARMQGFVEGPGEALGLGAYAPGASCDPPALERLCRRWLRRHR